jgi:K+/H+ antiporter YhaU regulatory subunit KhtT
LSIQIENLTAEQVEMCDIMWSFESAEEYMTWYELLDEADQQQADVLQHIIIQESMEEMLSEISGQYADIRDYLKKIML